MSVKVRLIGDLRRFVDCEALEIMSQGCSVGVALDELVERYPSLGRELFDGAGRLRYSMTLALGGRRILWPQGRDELIEDGGELIVTRFHCGG